MMNSWFATHQDVVSHRMMKKKMQRDYFTCFLCVFTCWCHISALMDKERKWEKRKRNVSPMVIQEEKWWGCPQMEQPSECLLQCIRCSLNTFSKVILEFPCDLLDHPHFFSCSLCQQGQLEYLPIHQRHRRAVKLCECILWGNTQLLSKG